MRPKISDDFPPNLADVMRNCWHENPDQRPSFEDLIQIIEDMEFPDPLHPKPVFLKNDVSKSSSSKTTRTSVNPDKVLTRLHTPLESEDSAISASGKSRDKFINSKSDSEQSGNVNKKKNFGAAASPKKISGQPDPNKLNVNTYSSTSDITNKDNS